MLLPEQQRLFTSLLASFQRMHLPGRNHPPRSGEPPGRPPAPTHTRGPRGSVRKRALNIPYPIHSSTSHSDRRMALLQVIIVPLRNRTSGSVTPFGSLRLPRARARLTLTAA